MLHYILLPSLFPILVIYLQYPPPSHPHFTLKTRLTSLSQPETTGVPRLLEALEANDWTSPFDDDELDLELDIDNFSADYLDQAPAEEEGEQYDPHEDPTFAFQTKELESEMRGLKRDIYGGGASDVGEGANVNQEEEEVEQLEALMLRMQAMKGELSSEFWGVALLVTVSFLLLLLCYFFRAP